MFPSMRCAYRPGVDYLGERDICLRKVADRKTVRCVDPGHEHLALGLVKSDGDQRRGIEAHTPSGPSPRTAANSGVKKNALREILCYPVYTMSNSVGIRELRQQASALLKRVVAGETIEVTDHGHPIARIVPLRGSTLDQLVLERRASDAHGDLLDIMDELGLPATPEAAQPAPSQVLAELRADER